MNNLLFSILAMLMSTAAAFLPPIGEAGTMRSKIKLSRFYSSSEPVDELVTPKSFDRRLFFGVTGVLAGTFVVGTHPAEAKYGASSNMELPNYIEYLVEKNSQGNESGALYKGADPVVLLRRLQDASGRLQEVPKLAETRKWSQIQGLLTGPLGTLSQTLNQIATPDSDAKVQAASKKLKADLIAIGQAASKKSDEACIAKSQEASKDLVSFLELAFE